MTIIAAADGSALGNPGPAGWAWYIDDDHWRAGGWKHGTNNMGELMAVLDLLRATADRPAEPLHILCDSQYVINSVTKWMPGWKKKGWKKSDGKPVLNVDLLQEIDAALVGRTYEFEWVKGHAGHAMNEAADVRARAAATAFQQGRELDAGPGLGGGPAAETVQQPAAPAVESEQDHLFSSFEDVQEAGAGTAELDAVVTLERELMEPSVRADSSAVAYLLHHDFLQVGSRGTVHDRDAAVAALAEAAGAPAGTFELLHASAVPADGAGADAHPLGAHLTYRIAGAGYALIVSSLWVRQDDRWRLRFRQSTPER
ncbi:ribonuclease HI family protein [Zhihengliuella flava]|uniref:Ribonuclease H n=1 Tax=Zhihengliuella flava TaxID=1285193 RepID=A0A931D8C7_9MICC|nr:ribonuclease HI family protein [Zhihengliuella flava]MBG6084264.1 ribonuclease HI [Zhihengliuella flava]